MQIYVLDFGDITNATGLPEQLGYIVTVRRYEVTIVKIRDERLKKIKENLLFLCSVIGEINETKNDEIEERFEK